MNKNSLIVAQNIGYKINENKLFHNISFDIKHGEALHIKGRNGSGKSTLIRIILGITEPVKGTIENKSTKEICYLGHKNALKTYLTLDDNINLMQLTNCDMLKSYLDELELNKYRDVTVSNLSFGQQKKLALLRVFLNNSDLIILDEPFVGLDDVAHTALTSFLNNELDKNKINMFELEFLKLRKKTRSWLGPILVFWLIMLAYPLTVEFLRDKLEIGFFSVLWIAILISMMLATEDIFSEDYNDGSLEQTLIKNPSFSIIIVTKIFTHWLLIGLPISILSFVFSLGTTEDLSLSLSILPLAIISSYIFLNLFVLGNALSLNKGSVLGALVTMPLALPVLIVLGKGLIAIQLDINYQSFIFLLLGSLSIIIVAIPIVVSYVIKAHLE